MAEAIARDAASAFTLLKGISDEDRSEALLKIYDSLKKDKELILKSNQEDMKNATDSGLAGSLVKRLDLSLNGKFETMLQGILDVANLPDPVGKCTLAKEIDTGLNLYRVTAPIGVLLVIFESRPEVIANITSLAIKSGNAAILKGGKESSRTFRTMKDIIQHALDKETKIPPAAIQLVETRAEVGSLLLQDKYIALVIPRGSKELVSNIKLQTKIPVLGHADGICSVYVDANADIGKAAKIVLDSKTNYTAACNAAEQLLVHNSIAQDTAKLKKLIEILLAAKVTVHVTPEIKSQLKGMDSEYINSASDDSFDTEYLSLDISVKSVLSLDEAIIHINQHSSKHTDCIVTENKENAEKFLKAVDSAGVYWNCSTRFADGFRYGFGTEVGISTNKIHSRGPVGLEGLVIYQYQLRGDGHIVSDYLGGGGNKSFIHKDIEPPQYL